MTSDYDPTIYAGAARHYLRGRPPYSAQLADVLAAELGLDGTGHLVDVGCGPGVLAVELAPLYGAVTAVDPDAEMLEEGRRHAARRGVTGIDWVQARAEELPDLGPLRTVTFGQSFQWMDREAVAEEVYDRLEPGGAIVLITPDVDAGPAPEGPGHPLIPHEEVYALIRRHLGSRRRAGQGLRNMPADRYEDALARTRFGQPRTVHAPGRDDIVRTPDEVVSNFLSMSYAAPHLFGDQLDAFVADLHALLDAHTTTGLFWDCPGDTAILIAERLATPG
jgi:SAM-dependent methyltransferase